MKIKTTYEIIQIELQLQGITAQLDMLYNQLSGAQFSSADTDYIGTLDVNAKAMLRSAKKVESAVMQAKINLS